MKNNISYPLFICFVSFSLVWYVFLDCPDPSTIFLSPLAVDDDANNLAVGENVTLKCVRGYTLFGDPSVTCFQNSTWAEEECRCLAGIVSFE